MTTIARLLRSLNSDSARVAALGRLEATPNTYSGSDVDEILATLGRDSSKVDAWAIIVKALQPLSAGEVTGLYRYLGADNSKVQFTAIYLSAFPGASLEPAILRYVGMDSAKNAIWSLMVPTLSPLTTAEMIEVLRLVGMDSVKLAMLTTYSARFPALAYDEGLLRLFGATSARNAAANLLAGTPTPSVARPTGLTVPGPRVAGSKVRRNMTVTGTASVVTINGATMINNVAVDLEALIADQTYEIGSAQVTRSASGDLTVIGGDEAGVVKAGIFNMDFSDPTFDFEKFKKLM